MRMPGRGLAQGLAVTFRQLTRRSVTAHYPDALPELPGFAVRQVDGRRCRTKAALLDEFARALEFAPHFGRNWDAFEDCLNDLSWLEADGYVIVVTSAHAVLAREEPDEYETFVSILDAAGREWATPRTAGVPRPARLFHVLLARPRPDWSTAIPVQHLATYIETTCYVGPVVFVLALGSLARRWRWWHTLTILCTWLALGSLRWYQPSSWLLDWPVFSSTHVVTRWRFVTALGLGMAAGSVLARWRLSGGRVARTLAVVLAVSMTHSLLRVPDRRTCPD